MKNKTVRLILAVIVLGVLTGGYFGVKTYVASQEEEAAEEEEEKTIVFETETDDVKSLKFMIDQKEVTFEREDDTWIMEDEKDFPVDQDTLDSAVSSISSIEAARVLEDVDDLAQYGLDTPSNTITITGEDDEDTVLRIGIKNDSTSQYYIRKGDDKTTVYVVSSSVVTPFMNSLYDYAEMQEFPTIDSSTVTGLEVLQTENSYEAEKDSDSGFWYIESEGESEKADSSKMNSVVSSLASLEYEDFADYNCTDDSKYGFTDPYAEITVYYEEEEEVEEDSDEDTSEELENVDEDTEDTTEDTDEEDTTKETVVVEKELTITVGKDTGADARYVKVNGSSEVYTMTNDLLSTIIDKDVSVMWDMTVYYLPLSNLESLNVAVDGQESVIDVSREIVVVEDETDDTDENAEESDDTEETADEESEDTLEDASEDTETEDEPETETVVTYKLNGEVLDDTLNLSTFYNKLINMAGQKRLMEEYKPESNADMQVTFHSVDDEITNVDFYEYDVNYYAAVVGQKVYLVNKMTYKELKTAYEELFAVDEDAESTETSDEELVEEESAEEPADEDLEAED